MAKTPDVHISITEVTVTKGKTDTISLGIDGETVRIKVAAEVKAYFDAQFVRANPTALQKKKFATIMNLLRAAYKAGKQAK
jgi:hypothetical protein